MSHPFLFIVTLSRCSWAPLFDYLHRYRASSMTALISGHWSVAGPTGPRARLSQVKLCRSQRYVDETRDRLKSIINSHRGDGRSVQSSYVRGFSASGVLRAPVMMYTHYYASSASLVHTLRVHYRERASPARVCRKFASWAPIACPMVPEDCARRRVI
ncbi:hypothetical protein BGW80DRAFT_1281478 [Lactifluus volemus]|nr:hypothetical protein BGW80DRAFT_1281478 [Lactifluus volemus]